MCALGQRPACSDSGAAAAATRCWRERGGWSCNGPEMVGSGKPVCGCSAQPGRQAGTTANLTSLDAAAVWQARDEREGARGRNSRAFAPDTTAPAHTLPSARCGNRSGLHAGKSALLQYGTAGAAGCAFPPPAAACCEPSPASAISNSPPHQHHQTPHQSHPQTDRTNHHAHLERLLQHQRTNVLLASPA